MININQTNQVPTFYRHKPLNKLIDYNVFTKLLKQFDIKLDEWQKYIIKVILAKNDDGTPQFNKITFTVPRQNGKTAIIEFLELFWIVIYGYTVVHTAHQLPTATNSFKRLVKFFDSPQYTDTYCGINNKGKSKINKTHGEMGIEFFLSGGEYKVVNRSAVSGLGFTIDKLVLDEAQEITDEQYEALSPTIISSANNGSQAIFLGTAPKQHRTFSGTIFYNTRQRAYSDKLENNEAYIEWGLDDMNNKNIDNPKLWKRLNPACDIRIPIQNLKTQSTSLQPEGFAREHLGFWYKRIEAKSGLFNSKQIKNLTTTKIYNFDDFEKVLLSLKYSISGDKRVLSFVGKLKNSPIFYNELLLYENLENDDKLLTIIKNVSKLENFAGLAIDGKTGTLSTVEQLKDLHIISTNKIIMPRVNELIESNAFLEKQILQKNILFYNQRLVIENLTNIEKKLAKVIVVDFILLLLTIM